MFLFCLSINFELAEKSHSYFLSRKVYRQDGRGKHTSYQSQKQSLAAATTTIAAATTAAVTDSCSLQQLIAGATNTYSNQ